MPLSDQAYPFEEGGVPYIMDPATGERYEVDPSGQAVTPNGPEQPWWGRPKPQTQNPSFFPNITTGRTDTTTGGGQRPGATAAIPGGTSAYVPNVPAMPGYNMQPGMPAQQWEADYLLRLADAQRLRQQSRAGIDEMIANQGQNRFKNQAGMWEAQRASTGFIPQWLPQTPTFQPGGYKAYEDVIGAGPGGPTGDDDAAAQTIWDNRADIQQLYKEQHPDWPPAQAVKDWWQFAPHEGANSLAEYARMKGWLK